MSINPPEQKEQAMDDNTAHVVLREMRDTALADVEAIQIRLDKEFKNMDEGADTVAIISRLQDKLQRRSGEAEALAIAVSKF